MALPARELLAQKGFRNGLRQELPDYHSPQRQDIGVVVLARQECGEFIGAEGGAYSFHLVRGDGYANPGGANQDAEPRLARVDERTNLFGVIGVIGGIHGECSAVDGLISVFPQFFKEKSFQFQAGMVGTQSDFHTTSSLYTVPLRQETGGISRISRASRHSGYLHAAAGPWLTD